MAKERKKWRTAWMYAPHVGIRRRKLSDAAVEKLCKQFEQGEPEALLHAVDFCARAGMAMPEWLAQAWAGRFENWVLFRASTLDDAFGVRRGGTWEHLEVQRRNARLRPLIVRRVLQLSAGGVRPIKKVFDRVAQEIRNHPDGDEAIFGRTVENIYYEGASKGWRRFFEALQRIPEKPPNFVKRRNV